MQMVQKQRIRTANLSGLLGVNQDYLKPIQVSCILLSGREIVTCNP